MGSRTNREINSSRVISGVSLARTLPPVLPPNFLTRKNVLSQVAVDRGGVTLIAAPAGYGKTSLVAEYVSTLDFPIVWLSFDDTDSESSFNTHLIQAVRNAFPNFGTWYGVDETFSTPEVLSKVLFELGSADNHIVMVLDNNRITNASSSPLADHFLDLLPKNLHIFAIRRNIPVDAIARLQSIPNFRLFERSDLVFSLEDIKISGSLQGLELDAKKVDLISESSQGWPAAVQLILNGLSRGSEVILDQKNTLSGSEQIKYLVNELFETMNKDDQEFLEALSVCDDFSVEIAEVILGEKFSLTKLNNIANEALFIRHTTDPIKSYSFNSAIKAGLIQTPKLTDKETRAIHFRLSAYFEDKGQHLMALEHARSAGDQKRYRNLFRQSMRHLIAVGRGKDLLRMAELVGDNSEAGKLKRQTVELIGLTADFQYSNAQSLIFEMLNVSRGTSLENFIKRFTSAVSVYIDFATGLDVSLDVNVDSLMAATAEELDLAPIDKISILKIAAAKEVIYDNSDRLFEIRKMAVNLAEKDNSALSLYFMSAIEASALLHKGEFKAAMVAANNALAQAEREGYTGIFGPLDVMYVKARCLLEFSQNESAQLIFEQIRNLATTWQQFVWVYISESFIARDLALSGSTTAALDIVRAERERAEVMAFNNGLSVYCDLTELFIRYTMSDWNRVGILLGRLPNFLLVDRVRPIYELAVGKTPSTYNVGNLPSRTPKEEIYKYMAEADENIDRESVALDYMRKALEVGAQVGAKETFLRQDARILNLIIRIAGEKPTVYLENLASLITSRLKIRAKAPAGLTAALTKRELEILRHLETGKPISAIAETLHVSQNTMKTHLKNVYRKIGARGRDEAVTKAKNLYIL